MNDKTWRLRRLTVMAMLVAISFVAVALIRIPAVMFLKYEPKDVLLTIGAFMFGPLAGLCMSAAVALLELVTVSDTGIIGLLMNVISSGLFVCVSSIIYRHKRTLPGAVIGLLCGVLATTIGMVLWNYLITPLYMDIPREQVAGMLATVFAPFNLLKGGINATLVMLLYKPVTSALRGARLLPPAEATKKKNRLSVWFVALFVFVSLILLLLTWNGII